MEGQQKLKNILPPGVLKSLIRDWLKEDTPNFDYGGFVVGSKQETAVLLCKSPGVLAGCPFFEAVLSELDCTVHWLAEEGDYLLPICQVAKVSGSVNNILLAERVALNCLARISGVATQARRLKEIAKSEKWNGSLAGTRKTTPGFRLAEKYGLMVGGVDTHRYDLSSMVMLKDNHIWSVGNITDCVQAARKVAGFSTKIEVECRSIAEAKEALASGAEVVMLDNFEPQVLHEAAAEIKLEFPNSIIEASGGIKEENIKHYIGPNIDVVSMGALTQGYRTVDFSLKILREGKDPANANVSTL